MTSVESTNVLPLFWHLSSSSTSARLDATESLVSTLDKFQAEWVKSRPVSSDGGVNGDGKGKAKAGDDFDMEDASGDEEDSDGAADEDDDDPMDALSSNESGVEVSDSDDDEEDSDDEDDDDEERQPLNPLDQTFDTSNSPDVVYTLKRLIRGLSSSRPNARLGFSVALTALLGQLSEGSEEGGVQPGPAYILDLVLRNSIPSKSMRGQEERDVMFARLFGLTAILESGILFRSSSSSTVPAVASENAEDESTSQTPCETYLSTLQNLLLLSTHKSWIRESSYWSLITSLRSLISLPVSEAPEWRTEAIEKIARVVFKDGAGWGQEKVALAVVLRGSGVDLDWKTLLGPVFKHGNVLHSANLHALGKILKDTNALEASTTSQTSTWKPQPHFVWEILLDEFSPTSSTKGEKAERGEKAEFGEFFRVVVEETLFDPSSTPQRKYWGFVVVQRLLPTLPKEELPMVFTKNFMKVWMNHLSGEDRYLHKIALSIAKQLPEVTKSNPLVGFTLLSQLVGTHGSQNFDRLTKTKTVESITGSLTVAGVEEYIKYLKGIFSGSSSSTVDMQVDQQDEMEGQKKLESQRIWATEQMMALLRNVQVPKADGWISDILELFLVHGLFTVKSSDKKSNIVALQKRPKPELSEKVKLSCRNKLFAAVIELTVQPRTVKEKDGRMKKLQGKDEAGHLWIARAVDLVHDLEKDTKHVSLDVEVDAEIASSRAEARKTLLQVRKASTLSPELAQGLEIILSFALLQAYGDDVKAHELLDDVRTCAEALCQPAASSSKQDAELPPLDLLLDVLLAYLEKGSADLRSLATFIFGLISPSATASTVEHLIAQLEHVGGDDSDDEEEEGDEEEEESSEESEDDEEDEEVDEDDAEESGSDGEGSDEAESEDEAMDVDPDFRRRIAEALKVNGAADVEGEDDDDSDAADSNAADDEEMLKIDDKLAAIFKQQAMKGKRGLKARAVQTVHFKARVLDLVEVFMRKQSTNPLIFNLISPLLALAANAGIAEKPLSTKATSVLASLGRATETPVVENSESIKEVLAEVHRIARTNPSKELAKICNECSIVLSKAAGHATTAGAGDAAEDSPVLATYRDSLKDLLTRKNSKVQSTIFDDFFKRQPLQSWPLRKDLLQYIQEDKVNGLHLRMAFGLVASLSKQFAVITKTVDAAEVRAFLLDVRKALYSALLTHGGPDGTWQEGWVKDLIKHALQIGRFSKVACTSEAQLSSVWAAPELASIEKELEKVERLASFPSVFSLLGQFRLLVDPSAKEAQDAKRAAKQQEKKRKRAEEGAKDVDEPAPGVADAEKPKKKAKGGDGKVAGAAVEKASGEKSKVKAKKPKVVAA